MVVAGLSHPNGTKAAVGGGVPGQVDVYSRGWWSRWYHYQHGGADPLSVGAGGVNWCSSTELVLVLMCTDACSLMNEWLDEGMNE